MKYSEYLEKLDKELQELETDKKNFITSVIPNEEGLRKYVMNYLTEGNEIQILSSVDFKVGAFTFNPHYLYYNNLYFTYDELGFSNETWKFVLTVYEKQIKILNLRAELNK